MNLFHLLPLLLFAASFSGRPAPEAPKAVLPAKPVVEKRIKISDEEIIPWSPEKRLVWEDFLCAPQKQGDAVASTSTSLGLSYQVKNGKLSYTITCNFSKRKSWGSLKTDYILAHEQAHFDITELHARKLYEALSNYQLNTSSFKKDIGAIYASVVQQKEDMQAAYDGETDHSRKRAIQYDWLEKIDTLLTGSEVYASYP